jgi:glycerol kinase
MERYLLALDQGTTSTRAILFRPDLTLAFVAQRPLAQHFPRAGWVEHDPEEIVAASVAVMREALDRARTDARAILAIGITNQRETTVLWDRATGRALHNAIVWQDRRTAAHCARLRADGAEPLIAERTGLLPDPYFSATKLAWLLEHVDGAREAAQAGRLAFGTVDSFLVWRLTEGRVHATDATNAGRTMLLDIRTAAWDADLCALFGVPPSLLPEVRDSDGDFGTTGVLGAPVPIAGVAGDQHAALIGQACFAPGMMKATYGTGCFALLNVGDAPVASRARLLSTIAYQIGGVRAYALEGAIFVAGAAVQWLRDGLGVIGTAAETESLAASADPAQDVILVPAFTGLGAPHWDAEARGALFGLTRATGPAELARAALRSVAFQTRDLVDAMAADWAPAETLRVDGGMTVSETAMQIVADLTGIAVERPAVVETTALGAAYLAGLRACVVPPPDEMPARWHLSRRWTPAMAADERDRLHDGWRDAVRRVLSTT